MLSHFRKCARHCTCPFSFADWGNTYWRYVHEECLLGNAHWRNSLWGITQHSCSMLSVLLTNVITLACRVPMLTCHWNAVRNFQDNVMYIVLQQQAQQEATDDRCHHKSPWFLFPLSQHNFNRNQLAIKPRRECFKSTKQLILFCLNCSSVKKTILSLLI